MYKGCTGVYLQLSSYSRDPHHHPHHGVRNYSSHNAFADVNRMCNVATWARTWACFLFKKIKYLLNIKTLLWLGLNWSELSFSLKWIYGRVSHDDQDKFMRNWSWRWLEVLWLHSCFPQSIRSFHRGQRSKFRGQRFLPWYLLQRGFPETQRKRGRPVS